MRRGDDESVAIDAQDAAAAKRAPRRARFERSCRRRDRRERGVGVVSAAMRGLPILFALVLAAIAAPLAAQDSGVAPVDAANVIEDGIVDTRAPRSQPSGPLTTPRPVYV